MSKRRVNGAPPPAPGRRGNGAPPVPGRHGTVDQPLHWVVVYNVRPPPARPTTNMKDEKEMNRYDTVPVRQIYHTTSSRMLNDFRAFYSVFGYNVVYAT